MSLNEIGGAGNPLYISGASGNFASLVKDLEDAVKDESSSFSLDMTKDVTKEVSTSDYLSDKTISVTLNGQTKTIKLDGITPQGSESFNDAFVRTLNEKVADAFGNGKLTAKLDGGKLTFTGNASDNFSISSGAGELVGLGSETLTSYLDTNKTLGDLLGDNMGGLTAVGQDDNGNDLYGLTINGVTMKFTKDTSLSSVMEAINSNTEAGVDVSYSKLTNEFVFTAKETGSAGKIEMGDDLAKQLFGDSSGYTQGTDAVFTATINGKTQTFTRSTNNVDLDGLKVTLEGTFDAVYVKDDQGQNTDVVDKTQGVSFSTKTNTDTIVDAIKQFVEDYNALVTEVKKAYSDMPLQQSNGSRYEPLTSEQEADMTESELKAYEEKAKTGILFMDSDLSSLYNSLRSAVTPGGNDGAYLRSIGINTSYSEGLTTISLDEAALREALETDPDGVRDAFAKSQKNGAATDGLMASIQSVTEKYAATTGATKGILIEKAGSQYAPSSALQNTMLDKMSDIDEQIEKWQDKMTNQVDYYTNKFTQLELLINQMNSQSSALAGLTGGY